MLLIGWALCTGMGEVSAATKDLRQHANFYQFPTPPRIARQVRLWEKIFVQYPSYTYVIHDARFSDVVVEIVDFKVLAAKTRGGRDYNLGEREKIAYRYLSQYQTLLNRVSHATSPSPAWSAQERKVWQVYQQEPLLQNHLRQGQARLRMQRGLAEDFKRAVARAESYVPYMEKVFREQGLPLDLTRLVFVESMFNALAVSRVGASGMWQFMPETARHFLILNPFIDERNSPFKATLAAARLLRSNFSIYQTWPLAVTAYNHGTIGISKAIKTLGTKNLDVIIEQFRYAPFGFDGRNYYSEFLAARNVYDQKYYQHNRKLQKLVDVVEVTPPPHTSLKQFIASTALPLDVIKAYNPCLKASAYSGNFNTPLPHRYNLVLPASWAEQAKQAIQRLTISQSPIRGKNSWQE